jgi:hypothetical protein
VVAVLAYIADYGCNESRRASCYANRTSYGDIEVVFISNLVGINERFTIDERALYSLGPRYDGLREILWPLVSTFCAKAPVTEAEAWKLLIGALGPRIDYRLREQVRPEPVKKPSPSRPAMRSMARFLKLCAAESARAIPGGRP